MKRKSLQEVLVASNNLGRGEIGEQYVIATHKLKILTRTQEFSWTKIKSRRRKKADVAENRLRERTHRNKTTQHSQVYLFLSFAFPSQHTLLSTNCFAPTICLNFTNPTIYPVVPKHSSLITPRQKRNVSQETKI